MRAHCFIKQHFFYRIVLQHAILTTNNKTRLYLFQVYVEPSTGCAKLDRVKYLYKLTAFNSSWGEGG